MKITVENLLRMEYIWNKEKCTIKKNGKSSEIKRLEFQYEAIDNDWVVSWIEPWHNEEHGPYLIIHCEDDEEME